MDKYDDGALELLRRFRADNANWTECEDDLKPEGRCCVPSMAKLRSFIAEFARNAASEATRGLADAAKPFVENQGLNIVKVIQKSAGPFESVNVTVTKGQFLALHKAVLATTPHEDGGDE